MADLKYIRDKRSGLISRVVTLPSMGQNSHFEEVTKADFDAVLNAEVRTPPPPVENVPDPEPSIFEEAIELGGGLEDDGEDNS